MNQTRFQNAIALRDSGQCENAIREFHTLESEVSSPDEKAALLINEHRCYCELGRLTEASRVIKTIRKLPLTDPDVRIIVDFGEACMHVQMGKLEVGLREFETILTSYPDLLQHSERDIYENIQIRRGVVLSNIGRHSEGRVILNEASVFTNLAAEEAQEVHFYLGVCHDELRESTLAKEEYLKAIAFDIDNDINAHAQYKVALIYFNTGAFAQARVHLEAILQAHGSDIPNLPIKYVYEQLSHVCRYLGEKGEATKYSKLASTSGKASL
jgi:tetratricopeptide (TPR) repeat protein